MSKRDARSGVVAAVLTVVALGAAYVRACPTMPLGFEEDANAGVAFVVDQAGPPDMVARAQLVTVPVTLRNTGHVTWDQAQGIHVSYRWRNFFGDLLDTESERTALPAPVAPGASAAVNARVEVPGMPGLYILDWALVWEHRGWTIARAAQPWVVTVMPTGYDAATAMVFLLAVGALATRSRAVTAWWVAGALVTRPLALVAERDLPLTPGAVFVTLALCGGMLALLRLLPARARLGAGWLTAAAATVLVLVDIAHVRFFGDVSALTLSGPAGRLGLLLPSAMTLYSGAQLALVAELLMTLPGAVASVLRRRSGQTMAADQAAADAVAQAHAVWSARAFRLVVPALAIAGLAVTGLVVHAARSDAQVFQRVYVVRDVGLYGYHLREAAGAWMRRHAGEAGPDTLADVNAWMTRAHAPPPAGELSPAFGTSAGMNVVVLQVESLQALLLGLRVNGVDITPTLNRLRHDALWFSGIYDQTSEGRTSDAEFSMLTSTLPASHGAAVFVHAGNAPVTLPQVLRQRGYSTLAAVPFDASFWNRAGAWPGFGFERSLFDMDFEPGPHVGWGLNDRDFLLQMAGRLTAEHEPFLAWLVTLSLHHPFDGFPRAWRRLDLGEWNRTPVGDFFEAMRLFDTALAEFLDALQANGLASRTLVVIVGDHDAGLPRTRRVAATVGLENRPEVWDAADRVPFIVVGAEGQKGEVPVIGGHTDVAPTVLGLLGIDASRYPFMGRDLLSAPPDRPVVRPYGGWVDSTHLFVPSSSGRAGARGSCYERATVKAVDLAQCDAGQAAATEQRRVADAILMYDLHQKLDAPLQRVRVRPPKPPAQLAPDTTRPAGAEVPRSRRRPG